MVEVERCYFESDAFAKKYAGNKAAVNTGVTPVHFKERMDQLIETGARSPTQISMSDWYYMRDHAVKCSRCKSKFAKLAAKNPDVDGPKVLE